MLTINSNLIERPAAWLKSNQPASAHPTTVNTPSLQKPASEVDTVKLSSQAIERTQAADTEVPANPYAATIVNFIQQQLLRDQADGDSKEQLAQRLEAGYKGFLQGFNDAYSLLGGAAGLPAEVNEALAQTKQQVGEAVAKLARDMGIQAPEIEVKTQTQTADLAQALDKLTQTTHTDNLAALAANNNGHNALAQSRSLKLQLTTAEGDIIELIANSKNAAAFDASDTELHGRTQESSQWTLSVNGDLNEKERGAIANFVNQLSGLADEFYQGDLAQAVSQARAIGFDNSQISAFSLSLQQIDIRRVENAYGGPQAGDAEVKNPQQTRWQALGQWLTQLEQLRTDSLNNALPENWLRELSVQSLTQWYPDNSEENDFLISNIASPADAEANSNDAKV
ncbi:MAG TPA: DUF5610 domain-containing protein [Cellvibrionaceae bacterium]